MMEMMGSGFERVRKEIFANLLTYYSLRPQLLLAVKGKVLSLVLTARDFLTTFCWQPAGWRPRHHPHAQHDTSPLTF